MFQDFSKARVQLLSKFKFDKNRLKAFPKILDAMFEGEIIPEEWRYRGYVIPP